MTEKEKLLIPRYRFRRVTDITPDDLRAMNASAAGVDIDNTITPDGTMNLIDGIKEWADRICEAGIPLVIISNGPERRVKRISAKLGGIPYVHRAFKPRPKGLLKAAGMTGTDIHRFAMIGDQLHSDIEAANRCGAIAVRTDPLPGKNLYPLYYKWNARREKPYLDYFDSIRGYGV